MSVDAGGGRQGREMGSRMVVVVEGVERLGGVRSNLRVVRVRIEVPSD